jgi:hypothetical protein
MLNVLSNVYYLIIGLPEAIWRAVKYFFGNTLSKWWYSHYQ